MYFAILFENWLNTAPAFIIQFKMMNKMDEIDPKRSTDCAWIQYWMKRYFM